MPKQPEEANEYGVKFPNGTVGWPDDSGYIPGIPIRLTGGLGTAQTRGQALDAWRNAVQGLGLNPDDVPRPKFITRRRITSWDEFTEVID